MTRRLASLSIALGLVLFALAVIVLRAADVVTLTPLPPADYPSPVGIDWLPTSNQLLISTYWNTGVPHNFETVDRGTGAHATWGAQSGWTDEIYFVTVRPGQPGGWVEGDVFSAKGSDTGHIAQFDSSGTLINPNFATLPGETKLKRGGLTFDRYNVPGLNGDLVVVAANDYLSGNPDFPPVPDATVWKVDSSGNATKIVDLSDHREGVVVIPNDPAYGPWAGKILAGREQSNEVEAIDPVTATSAIYSLGVPVEDIWVVPPNSDFYGVDHQEQSAVGLIWTAPAAQWKAAGLVGKVLLAEEHGAHLWTATWNGSSFDITEVSGTGPVQWEHITFAPAPPNVMIKKFTNGADANDPNGTGVPNIAPGGTVTWTYVVTNTGGVSVPRSQVVVTDSTTGVTPTFTSEISGNGDTTFDPNEVWLYTATGTALNLTLPPPPGVTTVANSCTAGGTQAPRTAYINVGTVTIPGATASDPSSYCNPPPMTGKSITIGPSSMEGAITISSGDWVNGGYSFKTNFTGNITIAANVAITGPCIGGTLTSDTLTVPLGSVTYAAQAGADWKPTGDQNSILSWEGSVVAPASLCGGGKLNANKGAVYNATITGAPAGGKVTFRFKYRDPAAKQKPNTNCLNANDPNRNKADVCGASWSETKTDP